MQEIVSRARGVWDKFADNCGQIAAVVLGMMLVGFIGFIGFCDFSLRSQMLPTPEQVADGERVEYVSNCAGSVPTSALLATCNDDYQVVLRARQHDYKPY